MGAFVGNAVGANLRFKDYTDHIQDNEDIVQQAMNLNIEDTKLKKGQIEE